MPVETPLEILHLPSCLRNLFTGKVAEAISGNHDEREKNFLSRSLAAYAIHKLAGCSVEEGAGALVDGGGDGGIDAVFYAPATQILWVAQSKFISTGRGEPDLGDVTKFKTGLENLLQGNFEVFHKNKAWRKLIPSLEAHFKNGSIQVRSILVYLGINVVSEDRRWLFEGLKQRFSPDSDYLEFCVCNLTTVYDWLIGADQGLGVPKVELTLLRPGWVQQPYETAFGLLPLKDLADLYAQHGKQLVVANIRAYKGSTDVNDQITATIKEEPEHFFYLNNGLTAYCERLEVHNFDRAKAESKRITAYGLSIVNGAQTLGSVAKFFRNSPNPILDGCVFLKIISLERCEDDRQFAERITRSTNFQNQIRLRDFVALDEQQETISNQLKLSGIIYHYKDDVETPTPDESNFTLEEATTAAACLVQMKDCDFCARILANRRSLWSMEEVYPAEELLRSHYSRVFRPDRSARTVWRAVQTQRLVVESMQSNARASSGVRKTFFENARWIVLNVIFLRLHPEQGDSLILTTEEIAAVSRQAVEVAEALWEVCVAQGYVTRKTIAGGTEQFEQARPFRSVFSTAPDCQVLRNSLLARLDQPANPSAIDASTQPPSSNSRD
ncbi:AIPR family protein [Trichocoleus sp. Lan]|uniref:AIPR family protein n=1 Tax=Trichocoleus sp. Lan TaxID=2933927 RepID=UPI003298E897